MNIGIDVDGVLVDIACYQMRTSKPYFEKLGYSVINPAGFDVMDIYGCTEKERSSFWHKKIWRYCISEPPISYAVDVLKKLHDDGHKLIIITSRVNTTEKGILGTVFRKMLLKWLRRNKFCFDKIVYCRESESENDKLEACIKNKVDVMIDDKPENLLTIADKTRVICYPAIWNEKLRDGRIIKVSNWNEIYSVINRL